MIRELLRQGVMPMRRLELVVCFQKLLLLDLFLDRDVDEVYRAQKLQLVGVQQQT